jgi:hypothetical protein
VMTPSPFYLQYRYLFIENFLHSIFNKDKIFLFLQYG